MAAEEENYGKYKWTSGKLLVLGAVWGTDAGTRVVDRSF